MERSRRFEKFGAYLLVSLFLYGTIAFFLMIGYMAPEHGLAKSMGIAAPLIYFAYHWERMSSQPYSASPLTDGYVSVLRMILRFFLILTVVTNMSMLYKNPDAAAMIMTITLGIEFILLILAKIRRTSLTRRAMA